MILYLIYYRALYLFHFQLNSIIFTTRLP